MPQESDNSTTVWAFLWAVKDHWIALMSGGVITVLLGVFERLSGKGVPLWVYIGILIFFAFLACYLAWRDERKKAARLDGWGNNRREFLADRLRALLGEAGQVDLGFGSSRDDSNISALLRWSNHRGRIVRFLEVHYDAETVKRFERDGTRVLEELLADCYRDNEPLSVIQKVLDRED